MAGVALRSKAPLASTADRVRSGVLARWGTVLDGACLEGLLCGWRVTSGGTVQVILRQPSSTVYRMNTDAPRWRTTRGIARGSTTRSLRRAYGSRISFRTTCALNGLGGINRGYILNRRHDGERRFTFFELSRSRGQVSRIWIGRGRVASAMAC